MPSTVHKDEAERERRLDAERKRISRQRNCFTFLPVTTTVETLKNTMLQRAYDLLWDGHAEECDAILEFLPIRDVEQMLDAWSVDQDDTTQPENYSRWYHRWMENDK